MRLAFLVLLLANLVLYSWAAGYWGATGDGREPERLQRQVAPEKLRILPEGAASPALASACRRIEWLSAAQAAALRDAVAALPGWEASQSPRDEPPAHWVVIPELASRALAEKKRTELLPPEKFALELRGPVKELEAQLPALTANLAGAETTACATP